MVAIDANGTPTQTDMGASFAIAPSCMLTLLIVARRDGNPVFVRVVDGLMLDTRV
ncbi:MAG: hypothetical protein ORN49_11195 [Rhodobacteraceae bacterium]|nr:hypothetical protein [Paracoccaceae bacterium]